MRRISKLSSVAALAVAAVCCGGSDSTSSPTAGNAAENAGSVTPNDPGAGSADGAGSHDAAIPDSGLSDGDAEAIDGGIDSGPRGAGCGLATAPQTGTYTIDVDGTARSYILDVPTSYDPNRAYKLVLAWHWRDGEAKDVANGAWASAGPYYGLKALADGSTIFVAPEGINKGWYNTNGMDYAFARALVQRFKGQFCIDDQRIFSVGFSFGGMFSFALGCEMPEIFRAIAPMSGALFGGCNSAAKPVAMWGAHGTGDSVVDISSGRSARDAYLARNGCSTTTSPTSPSPCVSYDGCSSGHPVVWCEWNGGHVPPSFSPSGIWNFFSQF